MRCGEKCPQCGYVERRNWIPSTWAVDEDVAPSTDDLDLADPQWAYRKSKDARYIRRMLKVVLDSRGGKWRLPRKLWEGHRP